MQSGCATGGQALSPASLQGAIDDLLDLHQSKILPAIKEAVPHGSTIDPKVVKTLEDALASHHFLLPGSDKPTLADVCVAIDLLSLTDVGALPGPVAAFTEARPARCSCACSSCMAQPSDIRASGIMLGPA